MTDKNLVKEAQEAVQRRKLRREDLNRGWTVSGKSQEVKRVKWSDEDLDDVWGIVEALCELLSGLRERVARIERGEES